LWCVSDTGYRGAIGKATNLSKEGKRQRRVYTKARMLNMQNWKHSLWGRGFHPSIFKIRVRTAT